jgi:hypothetical protein
MEEEKTGRPPYDFTEEEILAAIDGSSGIMLRVAQKLKCTWATARKYVEMHPTAVAAMSEQLESVLDVAENNVFQAINSKDLDMTKWFLSRKGRARGYGDQVNMQHSGKDDKPIETKTWVVEIPSTDNDSTAKDNLPP